MQWYQVDELTDVTSLFSWDIFIHETLEQNSCFVRNCKLQQVQLFWKNKPFFILQSCSGNMFAGFGLMELLQWWDHVQAFKKVQGLAPAAKGRLHTVSLRDVRLLAELYLLSEKCAVFHNKIDQFHEIWKPQHLPV